MLSKQDVAYVTPDHRKNREFFDAVLKYLPARIVEKDNKSDLSIKLITGGSLTFFSGNSLDQFRGSAFDLVICDEAAFIADLGTMWKRAILPTLLDRDGEAIFISTPYGKNFFFSIYQKGVNKEPGWESFHFTTYQNPTLSKRAVDLLCAELTDAEINEEILAIAGENKNNPIGTAFIRANTIQQLSTEPTVVYSWDVAKKQDWSVCIGLDINGCMTYFDRFQRSWTDTMAAIAALPANVTKVMDATGAGDVMFETLLNQGVQNLHGFQFNTQTKPRIITEMIRDIQSGKLQFNQITADELSVLEETKGENGYSKYAAMSGCHDDCVMALAMANHYKHQAVAASNWQLYVV